MFDADGARFVKNTSYPRIYDANHIVGVTAATPAEIDALLARAEREYAHCAHRRYHADARTPAQFEARLLLDGYVRDDSLVMLLTADLRAQRRPYEIRLIETDDGWRAYTDLKRDEFAEFSNRNERDEPAEIGAELAATNRLKCPPVRYWMAYEGSEPAAFLSSWAAIGGMGQVEDLYVRPDSRHRGIATALLAHCVADCRAEGAGPVVIACDPTDTPKQMYAAMGWTPVAVKRYYHKRLS